MAVPAGRSTEGEVALADDARSVRRGRRGDMVISATTRDPREAIEQRGGLVVSVLLGHHAQLVGEIVGAEVAGQRFKSALDNDELAALKRHQAGGGVCALVHARSVQAIARTATPKRVRECAAKLTVIGVKPRKARKS